MLVCFSFVNFAWSQAIVLSWCVALCWARCGVIRQIIACLLFQVGGVQVFNLNKVGKLSGGYFCAVVCFLLCNLLCGAGSMLVCVLCWDICVGLAVGLPMVMVFGCDLFAGGLFGNSWQFGAGGFGQVRFVFSFECALLFEFVLLFSLLCPDFCLCVCRLFHFYLILVTNFPKKRP